MQKQNIETIVKEYATENFNLYPESYPLVDGLLSEEGALNYQDLAVNYWDHRNESEVERDNALDITKIDYVDWVGEAISTWIQEQI